MVSGTSLSIEQQQPIVARRVWRLGKTAGENGWGKAERREHNVARLMAN